MKNSSRILVLNFRRWRGNLNIIIPFLLAFVCILMLCSRIVGFIRENDYTINLFEIFVCIFNDQYSIVLTSVLIIALFHNVPEMDSSVPYYLVRTDCKRWLFGQILYIVIVCFVLSDPVLDNTKFQSTERDKERKPCRSCLFCIWDTDVSCNHSRYLRPKGNDNV